MQRLAFVGFGVAIVLWAGCGRLSQHPLALQALEEVRTNTRVAEALGGAPQCGPVRGIANETDGIAHLEFDASGSRGRGIVVVEGKKTRDVWGVTMLELRPTGAERIPLTADLEEHTGVDTPKFEPGAASSTPAEPVAPPADVEIALPPGPPGQ